VEREMAINGARVKLETNSWRNVAVLMKDGAGVSGIPGTVDDGVPVLAVLEV